MAKTSPTELPTTDQESGVWTPDHAPRFYRPGDNPSALQIIQEMRGEYNREEEEPPLPVSAHTASLSRRQPGPDPLLPASDETEDPPFAAELDSLQFALQRLQLSFPRVTSIDEQLKLASAINLITASIARMVRTQKYIASHRPVEYNREVQAALEVVMKEWASTK
jgi:hypothetical protein